MTAYEIAAFYKGSYEPANNSAEAQMVVKMNAKDFEAILEELEHRKPPTDDELKGRREKLEEAIRPLIKVLAEDHHPHHTCIVRSNGYELSEGVMCSPIHDYIQD